MKHLEQYMVVINTAAEGPSVRHIVKMEEGDKPNSMIAWYYNTYNKLKGDIFNFCYCESYADADSFAHEMVEHAHEDETREEAV